MTPPQPKPEAAPGRGLAASRMLAADVDGALLLLSYAARAALAVDEQVARTVARSAELLGQDKLAGDELARFYSALEKLAATAAPVTVAGLRAAAPVHPPRGLRRWLGRKPRSDSQIAVSWYWRGTMLGLLLLVVIQIHWVVGSVAMESLQKGQDERTRLAHELNLTKEKLGAAARSNAEFVQMESAKLTVQGRIAAYSQILLTWNNVWTEAWRACKRLWALISFAPPDAAPARADRQDDTLAASGEADASLATTLARTRFILLALQTYMLPLLYGLLGACTYVLRTLSRDVKALTYTPDSHVRYKIRLVLGTLSGLAITWFFEPGVDALKLSPLALAFLAGYSVEILFAAMDRFVGAFSGAAAPAPAPAPVPAPAPAPVPAPAPAPADK